MFLLYLIFMLILFGMNRRDMSFELQMIWLLVTFSVTAITGGLESTKRYKRED